MLAAPAALLIPAAAEAGPALADDIRPTTFKDNDGKDIPNGWTSDHPTENVSILFACDARNGMGALTVSGGNNDATYAVYDKLWAIWMR